MQLEWLAFMHDLWPAPHPAQRACVPAPELQHISGFAPGACTACMYRHPPQTAATVNLGQKLPSADFLILKQWKCCLGYRPHLHGQLVWQQELACVELMQQQHLNALRPMPLQGTSQAQ